MYTAKQAAEQYFLRGAQTAGKLKSYQVLLERALVLVQETREGNLQSRDRCQDILAQIQSGLRIGDQASRDLFKVMGILWDALDNISPQVLEGVEARLRELRNLIIDLQKTANYGQELPREQV